MTRNTSGGSLSNTELDKYVTALKQDRHNFFQFLDLFTIVLKKAVQFNEDRHKSTVHSMDRGQAF